MEYKQLQTNHRDNLILFDWDDTLFPKTFLTTLPHNLIRMDFETGRISLLKVREPELHNELHLLDSVASKNLIYARTLGTVKIVTHSSKNMVIGSCGKYMPLLENILHEENIEILSTYDEHKHNELLQQRVYKTLTFSRLVTDLSQSYKQVVSIGDGKAEERAVEGLEGLLPKNKLKFVKFKPKPDVSDLVEQLAVLTDVLDLIINDEKNVRFTARKK